MKRGCFIGFLTWALCTGAYWYFIHARLRPPLDWIVPVVAGFVMAVIVGTLRIALANAVSAARLSTMSAGPGVIGEKPDDGQVVSVSGHIRALGSPLRAPVSGRPAVAYSYEISHVDEFRNEQRNVNDFAGFALAPCAVDSSYGSIRILGFPELEAFDKELLADDPDAPSPTHYKENLENYIAATEFADLSGFKPMAMAHEVKQMMTDDSGHLRKDWRMIKPPEKKEEDKAVEGADPDDADDEDYQVDELEGKDFFEQIVAPGEQVCVIGRYSAAKGGLVPDPGRGTQLQLLRGDRSAAAGSLWQKMAGNLAGALVFAAIVNGILFGVLKLHQPGPPLAIPKSEQTVRKNIDALHDAARNADIAAMEQLVADGTPVDARDEEQATPLIRASDPKAVTWLIAHGADVNAVNDKGQTALMERASAGAAEAVRVLLKAGAALDTVSTEWKSTALQQALDAERLEVVQILRDAGAHDDTVTEKNGHAVDAGSPEVSAVEAYLDAIQREDRAALNTLGTRGPYDTVDFKIWKSVRFAKGRLVTGFANDNAATISMRGALPGGRYATWTYQLAHRDGAWKVGDERWETRFDGPNP